MANWGGVNQGIGNIFASLADEARKKQDEEKMMQSYIMQKRLEQQMAQEASNANLERIKPILAMMGYGNNDGATSLSGVIDTTAQVGDVVPVGSGNAVQPIVRTPSPRMLPSLSFSGMDMSPSLSFKPASTALDGIIAMRQDQFNQKEWDKIVRASDPQTASSRSTLGMASNSNLRSRRALITLDSPVTTYADLGNIIADIAGIFQGGSPSDTAMKHQDYGTIVADISRIKQYWTGKPNQAVPPQIKQKIKEVINNIIEIDNRSIKNHFNYIEKAYPKIISNYKDEWSGIKDNFTQDLTTESSSTSTSPNMVGKYKLIQ